MLADKKDRDKLAKLLNQIQATPQTVEQLGYKITETHHTLCRVEDNQGHHAYWLGGKEWRTVFN